ncbi:MAG: hypothetical protein HY655_09820, partial [Acidobacteria bacterium]|nr:hypothetical protein [Acidobacteriota bacterium]
YLVASRFDAATFAIYAVGCLQIPLVDLVCTSTANVMMVRMAEDVTAGRERRVLTLWHDTTCKLALLIFPLAAFLLMTAPAIIVTLFTTRYLASVPIFMIWCLTVLPAAFSVDAVLRVYAQTRFLLVMNLVRLALIAILIGWCLSVFGLAGAVLITLLGTTVVKTAGVIRIARLLHVSVSEVLPWKPLAAIAIGAAAAAAPAFWVSRSITAWPPLAVVATTGVVYAATLGAVWYVSVLWSRANLFDRFSPVDVRLNADAAD